MKKKRHDYCPLRKITGSQFFFVMKLSFVMTIFAVLSVSANVNVMSQQVTLNFKDAELREVFRSLREQTGHQIIYSEDKLEAGKTRVSVALENVALSEALDFVLRDLPYAYVIKDLNVMIVPKQETLRQTPDNITVTGRVTDTEGKPLSGVTVTLKGTKQGVATDVNGTFSIKMPTRGKLIFSSIGKKTLEVEYAGQADIHVLLEDEVSRLEDVIVTGLFSRPAESYTGAARTITREQISQVSSNSLLQALSILDPSIQMPQDINLGSNPNALAEITLRGGNSLIDPQSASVAFNYKNNPNTPLFILDGFEVSLQRVNDLDINRVLSVVTLKDATATTIYGSRAANGVIVIETIPAERGRFRVSYTGQATFEFPDLKGYDLLNAREKYELDLISTPTAGFHASSSYKKFYEQLHNYRLEQIERGVDFDWLRLPLRNAFGHKHTV